jgi:hypothetical protein
MVTTVMILPSMMTVLSSTDDDCDGQSIQDDSHDGHAYCGWTTLMTLNYVVATVMTVTKERSVMTVTNVVGL